MILFFFLQKCTRPCLLSDFFYRSLVRFRGRSTTYNISETRWHPLRAQSVPVPLCETRIEMLLMKMARMIAHTMLCRIISFAFTVEREEPGMILFEKNVQSATRMKKTAFWRHAPSLHSHSCREFTVRYIHAHMSQLVASCVI